MQRQHPDTQPRNNPDQISHDRRNVFSSLGLLALGGGAAVLAACEALPPGERTEAIAQELITPPVTTVLGLLTISGAAANETRLLPGYATASDGGGGLFLWTTDTTTPQPTTGSTDGNAPSYGLLVVPTASPRTGCWKRVFTGPPDVRWFGAVGNGVADDAPAFRKTIAASAALTPPPAIYVPAGKYLMGSSISTLSTVNDGKSAFMLTGGQVMYGDGRASVILWKGGAPRPVPFTQGNDPMLYSLATVKGRDISFHDLAFQGENGNANGEGYCFSDNYQRAAIDVWFDSGVGAPDYTMSRGLEVRDCFFENLYGFSIHDGAGVAPFARYVNNVFRYCGNGLNPCANDLDISGNVFVEAEGIEVCGSRLRIANNSLTGKTAVISVTGNPTAGHTQTDGVAVIGNTLDMTGGSAAVLGTIGIMVHATNDAVIANNTIRNPPLLGIYLLGQTDKRTKRADVSGNVVFRDALWVPAAGACASIQLNRCDDCTVANNTVSGGEYGVELLDVTSSTVSSNVARAGRTGYAALSNSRDITFSGNVAAECSNAGMDLQGLNGGALLGNRLKSTTGFDLLTDGTCANLRASLNRWATTLIANGATFVYSAGNGA